MIEWLTAIYFTSFIIISIYTASLLVVVIKFRRHSRQTLIEIHENSPDVTIQIPLFNPDEITFINCIEAVEKISYPKKHLQIQVLDDSTKSSTIEFIKDICTKKEIELIHRDNREGYRAGAFANSMSSVLGEYIAIINVDCIPSPNFLEMMVSAIHNDPKNGYIMSNHVYYNRFLNNQTRVTSIILDMGIMNLNGLSMLTGGGVVIRKQAIIDAGGWQGDTICDDYDTGARILAQGYNSIFFREVLFPCEAPENFRDYRKTTERWARASGQYIRKDIFTILKGKLSTPNKFLLLTLSTGFIQMLASVINLLTTLVLIYFNAIPGKEYVALWSIVSLTGFSLCIYYYHVTHFRGLSMKSNIRYLLLAIVIGYGSIFFITYNLLKGLLETGVERAIMRVNTRVESALIDIIYIILTSSIFFFAFIYSNVILAMYMVLNLLGIILIRTEKV